METPIFDFVKRYNDSNPSRFHMPGHKGAGSLGCEKFDITEIDGADVLYSADGIIKKSEDNASSLFGTARTLYSTEGSSLCIRAMLGALTAKSKNPYILAARGVHKAFVYGCAAADIDVDFIYPSKSHHLCDGVITDKDLISAIETAKRLPDAVYITSPDYLGNITDIAGLSRICKEKGILLLVDNAHGAYLNFLRDNRHPIHLGADICCDSAHKTLPVLTGGAYLHISKNCPAEISAAAEKMMSVFASTSPSYLILQSLDLCNKYLADSYREKLARCIAKTEEVKEHIKSRGFSVADTEPLKIVINTADISGELRKNKIIPEFYDNEYLVLMITPENSDRDFERLVSVFDDIPLKPANSIAYLPSVHKKALSIREAVFSHSETVNIEGSIGRICAAPTVSCPPAVPLKVSGEIITADDILLMKRYGIKNIDVIK